MAHRGSGNCFVHVFVQPCFHGSPYDANLVPLSVTKRHPVHFILNPGQVEYELGVLMV